MSCYFGFAAQHLSSSITWWSLTGPRFFLALMLPTTTLCFVDVALNLPQLQPRLSLLLRVLSLVLAGLAGLLAIGFMPLVDIWPVVLGVPVVIALARPGERLTQWVIVGWLCQFVGLAIGSGLHRGYLPWKMT